MQFIKLVVLCFISVGISLHATAETPEKQAVILEADFYTRKIQPIFDSRCLACHSCFNAPCQLNLQNFEGFQRGANKLNVYNGTRLKSVEPSRLWVDAHGEEWRKKGFFSVSTSSDPAENLFFQLTQLRNLNPTKPISKQVAETQVCPQNMTEYRQIEKAARELGMPYGLPALGKEQLQTLEQWVKAGTPGPTQEEQRGAKAIPDALSKQVRAWEKFLNDDSLKQKLVSRYVYEHLFLAHIHFPEVPGRFFRLVRSRTACSKGVDEIATRRPNDSPEVAKFWYCLRPFPGTIVQKTHIPYEWSPKKLERYKELFFSEKWSVKALPGYEYGIAENPFLAFRDIPVRARYRFLLEDAQYHVSTFIKGPVCNGSMAVNSIQEQFYTFFLDPESDNMVLSQSYQDQASNLLMLPGVWGSEVDIKATPVFYKKLVDHREAYRKLRTEELKKLKPEGYALKDIWNGDRENPNAVLTIFRHDDNAVVMKGAVGDLSKTVFVLDYPLFERLVYNLVVNFDVFGNVSHQLLTRVYMDMIRMEAEELFLMFLPAEDRLGYRRDWYRGFLAQAKMSYVFPTVGSGEPTSVRFNTDDHTKKQLVEKILFFHMNEAVRGRFDFINWKHLEVPDSMQSQWTVVGQDQILRKIAAVKAKKQTPFARFFPDLALLHVKSEGGGRVYSIIHNKEHENISWILGESLRMDPENDTLTIREGFWGSYPNMIFAVTEEQLPAFVDQVARIKTAKDYAALVKKHGVRRSNPNFWASYDFLTTYQRATDPVGFGYLDLTRYELDQ